MRKEIEAAYGFRRRLINIAKYLNNYIKEDKKRYSEALMAMATGVDGVIYPVLGSSGLFMFCQLIN